MKKLIKVSISLTLVFCLLSMSTITALASQTTFNKNFNTIGKNENIIYRGSGYTETVMFEQDIDGSLVETHLIT